MTDAPKQPEIPPKIPYFRMAFHAGLAAIVFFWLNRFALDQPLGLSLLWAAVAALFAAYVAYGQGR